MFPGDHETAVNKANAEPSKIHAEERLQTNNASGATSTDSIHIIPAPLLKRSSKPSQTPTHNPVVVKNGDEVPKEWTETKPFFDSSSSSTPVPLDRTVVELFEQHVENQPHAPALEWDGEVWTYQELSEKANRIAHLLRSSHFFEGGIQKEEPVGVFMEQSAYPVLAMLAIIKAGGSYVPLDVTFQNSHVAFALNDTGANLLIMDSSTYDRCVDLTLSPHDYQGTFLDLDEDIDLIMEQPTYNPSCIQDFQLNGQSRFHFIFTSGSTGKPKGIEILHQGFIRLSLQTNWINVTNKTRFGSMANYAFDASSFEVWSTLLNGGTIVVIPRSLALIPSSLKRFLQTNRITMMFLTTQLFHLVAQELPDAFGTLDQIVIGGEALSPQWCRVVLSSAAPPKRLTNGYGPAENSACTTFHDVTLQDVSRPGWSVPIGKPLTNTEVLLLNPVNAIDIKNGNQRTRMEATKVGQVGELCVAGPGLARGYVNRPDITASSFIPHPFKEGERLYRTGDLARWGEDGLLYYEGRNDRQVKIRGFRIELTGIETVIRQQEQIRDVAVVVREDRPGSKQIVAYCIPSQTEKVLNDLKKIHFLCSELRVTCEEQLPPFMIPSAFIILAELPVTPNGKLDTKSLPAVCEILNKDPSHIHPPVTSTEKRVHQIWLELLQVPAHLDIGIHAEFHDVGGDSLSAAKLLILVEREFNVKCPAYEFFGLPTIANLARIIDVLGRKDGADSECDNNGETSVNLRKEIELDPSILPSTPFSFKEPEQVLLTGATGFLGAYLLRDLLQDTSISKVYALVRAKDQVHAHERVRANLAKYDIWEEEFGTRVSFLTGDFSKPMLGLGKDLYDSLCGSIDTVIHNGAMVDYAAPYSSHKSVNVGGTVELIKFCFESKTKSMQYLSTLAVFGPVGSLSGVKDIYEDTDLTASVEPLQADMGYAQSKWVAEMIIEVARQRGLPVNIFRPGFILCDGKTGVSNLADFMVRITKACTELGYYPLLENQGKEFLTVDYASATLIALMKKESALNQRYHLCRPDGSKHPLIVEYFEMLAKRDYDIQGVEFSEWVSKLSSAVLEDPEHPMLALMPMMAETIREDHTRWELYDNMPDIHCDNCNRELEGTGVEFAYFDDELMDRYVGNLRAKGILPERTLIPDVVAPLSKRRSTFRRSTMVARGSIRGSMIAQSFSRDSMGRASIRDSMGRASIRDTVGDISPRYSSRNRDSFQRLLASAPIYEEGDDEDKLDQHDITEMPNEPLLPPVRPSGRRISCLSAFI